MLLQQQSSTEQSHLQNKTIPLVAFHQGLDSLLLSISKQEKQESNSTPSLCLYDPDTTLQSAGLEQALQEQ